jgi:predicted dinucleotide-binding enzyme
MAAAVPPLYTDGEVFESPYSNGKQRIARYSFRPPRSSEPKTFKRSHEAQRRSGAEHKRRAPVMKTAVIGLGNIGSRVAKNLTAGGQKIIVADKALAKAQELASELGRNAEAMPVDDAVGRADIIILAVYFEAIKQMMALHGAPLVGKIIVDPSNPIAPDGKGGFKKTIPAEQSSGQLISALLPEGARLVKAFGTLSAESLGSAANRLPKRAVLFYATDHPEAGKAVAELIAASGFSPVSVGGIAKSIRIEVGGDLHEFGNLGKLISAEEAAPLI